MGESTKKTYWVSIPIAGSMSCTVEADSEEAAKEAAWTLYNEQGPEPFEVEWEAMEQIATGNVLHAPQNCVEAGEA